MLLSIFLALYAATQAASLIIPRDGGPTGSGPPDPGDTTQSTDPGLQTVPDTGKPDNTFNNGVAQLNTGPPWSSSLAPPLYQPREIDIPFGWMFHGNISMFPSSQLNSGGYMNTDSWDQNVVDSANQSACGIPDRAYFQKQAAIHPYFLKYAGLDRRSNLTSSLLKQTRFSRI